MFEDAEREPSRIDEGALNLVVVGAGPTGVETAGAVADLVNDVMPKRYRDLDVDRANIYLIDHGPVVLGAFSDKAQTYAAERLTDLGVAAPAADRRVRRWPRIGSCSATARRS